MIIFGRLSRTLTLVGTLAASSAAAAPQGLTPRFTPVDPTAVLPGFVSQDVEAFAEVDWTVAAMVLNLTDGAIYQDPLGADNSAPNPGLFDLFPTVEFDTYVRGNIAGAAGDVGGSSFAFNTQRLDATWFNTAPDDNGWVHLGRLTLSQDAAGALALGLWARDQDPVTVTASIVSGVITLDPTPNPLLLDDGGGEITSGGSDGLLGDDRLGATEGDSIESRRELLDAFAELRRVAQELAVPRQPAFNVPGGQRVAVAVSAAPSAEALPEPSAALLFGLGLTWMGARRVRRR